jgi:hypothetical protein
METRPYKAWRVILNAVKNLLHVIQSLRVDTMLN